MVSVTKEPALNVVATHVPDLNTTVNFQFKPSLNFQTSVGKKIQILDAAKGDYVKITAQPTPNHALDYTAKLGIDTDLRNVTPVKATVSAISSDGQTFTIAVKDKNKYTISLASGPHGLALGQDLVTQADLQVGSKFELAGVVDTRFGSLREVSELSAI